MVTTIITEASRIDVNYVKSVIAYAIVMIAMAIITIKLLSDVGDDESEKDKASRKISASVIILGMILMTFSMVTGIIERLGLVGENVDLDLIYKVVWGVGIAIIAIIETIMWLGNGGDEPYDNVYLRGIRRHRRRRMRKMNIVGYAGLIALALILLFLFTGFSFI